MKDFLGKNGFVWWHGVVEDVNDPLFLGRCRVRVFGFHLADKEQLPTDSLPWAYPMQPITSAALSGIGTSPTGLLVGSHVFGFFRDGDHAQDPVIIGSFGGIPTKPADTSAGFNDPSGKYPAKLSDVTDRKVPFGVSVVGEQDTNRLARNDDSNVMQLTVVAAKRQTTDNRVISTPGMLSRSSWSEPQTPYAAVYPKNHVRFTESGHVEEYDDTPNKERIHHFHKSGSFVEIANGWQKTPDGKIVNPDGTRVQRIVGNDYEIIHGNKKIHIRGGNGLNLVVDGAINLTVNGDSNIEVGGKANVLANDDLNLQVEGNLNISAGKSIQMYAGENMGFSGRSISLISAGNVMVLHESRRVDINTGSPVLVPFRMNLGLVDFASTLVGGGIGGIGSALGSAVGGAVSSTVGSVVNNTVGSAVGSVLNSTVGSVGSAVNSAVGSVLNNAVGSVVGGIASTPIGSAVGSVANTANSAINAANNAVSSTVNNTVNNLINRVV